MSKLDPAIEAHRQWLGFAQPVGLVVSPHALVAAQAHPDKNIAPWQEVLIRLTEPPDDVPDDAPRAIRDLPGFLTDFLGWPPSVIAGSAGGPALADTLTVAVPDRDEHLRPTFAVADPEDPQRWTLLIEELPLGTDLDRILEGANWPASPQARMERLLRETDVPIAVLCNGTRLRLVYRPRGETPGHVTFAMDDLARVDGRPLVAALHMLLSAERVFSLPLEQRLPAILAASRRYQNTVSTRLADQVLVALSELLRGFQSADEFSQGQLLAEALRAEPGHVYGGLLSTLMRLVFALYTEDQGLMPSDSVYTEHYSVWKLFEQLREDDALYHDSMDQRYGAWGRLLALFRLIHDGAEHGTLRMPPRGGRLFNPDSYPFLEGRPYRTHRSLGARQKPPHISDGVVFRLLEKLLVLDGERLSYRALDVEQIGSVYEAMMGFVVEVAKAPSLAVGKKHVVVDLEVLLALPGKERNKKLKETSETEVSGKAATALVQARTLDDLEAALARRRSPLTPHRVGLGGLCLQPTDERRRSGSNYTPRALTQPIVQRTLEPVLADLGPAATPDRILALKVCDPAMGSGAFLVEACRQLAERLVQAWEMHQSAPAIPPDEDALLHARRLIAQRCLYGVDKNPYAVDLAKLSLWLVTFAKDHPFTFVDHALRNGDSLVGLTREQIASFHWVPQKQLPMLRTRIEKAITEAEVARGQIHALADSDDLREKARLLSDAEEALAEVLLVGDLCLTAFFSGKNEGEREELRVRFYDKDLDAYLGGRTSRAVLEGTTAALGDGTGRLRPFHWHLEFPEVFSRENGGFDVIVGNPPFLGGTRISTVLGMPYFAYLKTMFPPAGHLCDLVAYFFRRSFDLLRDGRALGLLATNSIAQGDTREGGLAWICTHGGQIYSARRRYRWPGAAAVVTSVVHLYKGTYRGRVTLDEGPAQTITSYLFTDGGNDAPARLLGGNELFSLGSKIYGQGFLFDDHDDKASPIADMKALIKRSPGCESRILPYLGGEEMNDSPTQSPHRWVIYLSDLKEEAELKQWPDLEAVVRAKVKPYRDLLGSNPNNVPLRKRWWAYQAHRPEFYALIAGLPRVLACSRVTTQWGISFQPTDRVFSEAAVVFALPGYSSFAVLQSRVHEVWARFFASSLKDDLRYTPTDCFETFPFPKDWERSEALELAGKIYYEFRAELMVRNNVGLTKTYNRFHSQDEASPDILRLRELHAAMDRAVLDSYRWTDLTPTHEFIPDFIEEDDEGRPVEKSIRYRWPDEFRDEVLAGLLALNQERAVQERAAAPPVATKQAKGKRGRASAAAPNPSALSLDLSGEFPI